MNIVELKELIKDCPDDMMVGGIGHFGNYLEVNQATFYKPFGWDEKILWIDIESPGDEPD